MHAFAKWVILHHYMITWNKITKIYHSIYKSFNIWIIDSKKERPSIVNCVLYHKMTPLNSWQSVSWNYFKSFEIFEILRILLNSSRSKIILFLLNTVILEVWKHELYKVYQKLISHQSFLFQWQSVLWHVSQTFPIRCDSNVEIRAIHLWNDILTCVTHSQEGANPQTTKKIVQ